MKTIVCVTGILATAFLNACSQDTQEPVNPVKSALANAVQGCITEGKACAAAAKKPEDGQVCADNLRACIALLLPMGSAGAADGGVPIPPISVPSIDAGVPSVPTSGAGAGLPSIPIPVLGDAGLPSPPILGGAGLPSVPAAGVDGACPRFPFPHR